jgi:DNA-binding SARP family transcriptional activator/tetratricopeptide (TPR) repeat protein/TolB-like protein
MAMLVVLALSRTRSASRDRLMALLWPEHETDRARHLLRESLYRLREALGEGALITTGDEVHLDPSQVAVDVWDLEAAAARSDWREVDRIYAGPLLDGFFLSAAPEFERWVADERGRLGDVHANALESLAIECGNRSDWLGAAALWRRRTATDPYNSRIVLRLMEALDAAGDRAAALNHATAHAALLKTELAAAPDPAVDAFAERLRHTPTERGPAPHDDVSPAKPIARETGTESAGITLAPAPDVRRRSVLAGLAAFGACVVIATGVIAMRANDPRDGRDADRIAILPFRTSGADPALAFLRDGLTELLSLQFTGDVGPVAIDPGEVLRAWPREQTAESTTPAMAQDVARRLRAAQFVYGSVVGNTDRFTVSATVHDAMTGAVRVTAIQVNGSLDSLPVMLAELSAKLLARDAGRWRLRAEEFEHVRGDVLRAYLQGMVEYRKANWGAALTHLFEALEKDWSFVPAAYRFALIHAITAPVPPLGAPQSDCCRERIYRLLSSQRHRLSPDQRVLLDAIAESTQVRWPQVALPRLERAVTLLPQTVEAWDILGNDYYHAGALVGHEDWMERAKRAFLTALAVDSTFAGNARRHLADLAFVERDPEGHARYATQSTWPRGPAFYRYQAAILAGDPHAIHRARVEYSRAWARGEEDGIHWVFRGLTLPQRELDSLMRQLQSDAATEQQDSLVRHWTTRAEFMSGRPQRGIAALQREVGANPDIVNAILLNELVDPRGMEAALVRDLPTSRPTASPAPRHVTACNVALSRLRRGDTTGVASMLRIQVPIDPQKSARDALERMERGAIGRSAICGEVARGILAAMSPSGLPQLLRADSIMRLTPLNYADWWNYEIALAFARRGDYAAAAAAVRRRFHDLLPLPKLVPELRDEARWAALSGDTASAVKAYRHYLLWRENPEPSLLPQRDSVQRELDALLRSQGRRW